MSPKSWYDAFAENMNPVFTEEDFNKYKELVLDMLDYYQKYLKKGAKILELGCGLGSTAVPLSEVGYDVVGIDNDDRVVKAAKQNGRNFGKKIQIIEGDAFDLNKMFKPDSFDICISGGFLEHFAKDNIRNLIELQLKLAPTVIASMPIRTEASLKHYGVVEDAAVDRVFPDGIYRNLWSEDEWLYDILEGFNIVNSFVKKVDPSIGDFEELFVVVMRDRHS